MDNLYILLTATSDIKKNGIDQETFGNLISPENQCEGRKVI
mgnify:CR=1 FL=1